MKKVLKKYYLNVIILLFGIFLMAVGGVLFLEASLGGDALLVMNQGLGNTLKVEPGTAMIISNMIVLSFIFIFFRKSIGLSTLLVTVLLGLAVNGIASLNIIKGSSYLFINILMVLAGVIVGGFGVALYIYADLGLSPFEGVIIFVMEKTKKRFFLIKIINDIVLFTLGFIMGGVIGIGSIMTVFLFGPVIDIYLVLLKKTKLIKQKEVKHLDEISIENES
ncbi:MAG: hypothetical protein M0P09_08975 [Acholeplasmataceae bacterium]|nr:hypothetical protein [Acholeplasmataceae bacterium]